MTTESLKQLIELCRAGQCEIKLEASQLGIVAHVTTHRGHVTLTTSIYLDVNEKEMASKLGDAVQRVQ